MMTDCTDKAFRFGLAWFMVFNATFNNISVISWWSVLLVEETGENHRSVARIDIDKDWQRLDKHERKVVKMVNYDLDKIDDSDR
jgi:hypothetical protein